MQPNPNDVTIYLHAWEFYFHITIAYFDPFILLSHFLLTSFLFLVISLQVYAYFFL